jgi:transposase
VIRRIPSIYQRHCQWHIERFFNKIKHYRRIATRYEKTAVSFAAMLFLVGAMIWLR